MRGDPLSLSSCARARARLTRAPVYAPEIASSMLKKQAAAAIVDARELIVKGAVGISQEAIASLEKSGLQMSDEEKFSLVSSLLIVVSGEKDATPVLKVGA